MIPPQSKQESRVFSWSALEESDAPNSVEGQRRTSGFNELSRSTQEAMFKRLLDHHARLMTLAPDWEFDVAELTKRDIENGMVRIVDRRSGHVFGVPTLSPADLNARLKMTRERLQGQ